MKRAFCSRCGLDIRTAIRRDASITCYDCLVLEAEGQRGQCSTEVPYRNPLVPERANSANNVDAPGGYVTTKGPFDHE
jgi:hypothetical protein